jgi:serine/threonine-protein kinase
MCDYTPLVAVPEPEALSGRLVAQRYELLEEIAQGGMGTVWVARDHKLGRQVALKLMRAQSLEAFPDARERFEREARAAAALKSSHVVQVHDYGVDDGTPFIAMELLEGESLKQRLEKVQHMGLRETSDVLRQVAKGLKAAHKAGLVHRDLKPSNIFLAHRDEDEIVKLLDFGVVKTPMDRGSDDTASGVLLGTPQYMSPEQARGLKDIDYRADMWSLAVIVYRMITGKNPFEINAEAVGDIVIRVAVGDIPRPSTLEPSLPPTLDAFFARGLARNRSERFQTLDQLVQSFMRCADVSYRGLDLETMSGDTWPLPVIPPDEASKPDAVTVAAIPRAVTTRSGWRARLDRTLPPRSLARRTALFGLVAIGIASLAYAAGAWRQEDPPGTLPTASLPAPVSAAASAPTATASALSRAEPDTPPSASPAPSTAKAPPSARPPTPLPPPPSAKPTAPEDDEGPPQWYQDKR